MKLHLTCEELCYMRIKFYSGNTLLFHVLPESHCPSSSSVLVNVPLAWEMNVQIQHKLCRCRLKSHLCHLVTWKKSLPLSYSSSLVCANALGQALSHYLYNCRGTACYRVTDTWYLQQKNVKFICQLLHSKWAWLTALSKIKHLKITNLHSVHTF